jgi:hypothetical protein
MTGWPTPRAAESGPDHAIANRAKSGGCSLQTTAQVAGWSTPQAIDSQMIYTSPETALARMKRNPNCSTQIQGIALQGQLTSWTTPSATDGERAGTMTEAMSGSSLPQKASLASWPTPQVHQGPNMSENRGASHGGSRRRLTPQSPEDLLTDSGNSSNGSTAATGNSGQLNPALPRWLQGLPIAWDDCAVMVTRSARQLRKPSSKHS